MLPVERLFFTRFLEQIRTLMVQKKNRRTNRVRGGLNRKATWK